MPRSQRCRRCTRAGRGRHNGSCARSEGICGACLGVVECARGETNTCNRIIAVLIVAIAGLGGQPGIRQPICSGSKRSARIGCLLEAGCRKGRSAMRYVKVECTNCLFSVWETEAYLKYLTQCPACESATTTDYELPTRRSWSIVARDGIRCPVCGRRMTGENLAEFYVEDACPACGYVGNSFVYSMRLDAFVCPNCGCVPTAEGHTQDALVRDLDACPQCEFRIRAPTKRQVQSGDYAFNHHYKDCVSRASAKSSPQAGRCPNAMRAGARSRCLVSQSSRGRVRAEWT